jgi:cytochrome c2
MSNAWRRKGLSWPELSEQDAADLFLYLYASRYFEAPGNAGRGRNVFRSKRCGSCHGMTSPIRDGIQPVAAWGSLEDAIALAQGMLNHRVQMRRAVAQSGAAYPTLSPQELTDLLVYLRSQVRQSGRPAEFSPGSPERGREVLASSGCLVCHQGSRPLEERPTRHTLMDFVSAMWNHPLQVSPAPPTMSYDEMRDLVGYLLSTQFAEERGDSEQGRRVYARKGCGACHDVPASGAPPRAGMAGRMNSLAMMEAVWKHGPGMLDRMRARKVNWPRIDSLEMVDLIAYLHGNQLRRR